MLDWSDLSYVTTITAQSFADSFFNYLFGQTHNGHSLAEIPIHLIGHSRGCSLNARLAYLLAENGVLVDQVTTLDPHPCQPLDIPFEGNDLIPATYINILFADNYWQSHSYSFPDGMPIPGAFNQDLSSVLTGLGWTPHTHVHTYYHGTIDLSATTDGSDTIETTWYQNTFSRDETGYNFSRYTNPLLPRPSSGINQFISGAGGTGSRVSVDSSQQLWSNAGFDQRSTIPSVVTVGQTVDIPYYFADRNSQQTITFYTDADTNPFNGQQSQIGSVNQNSRPAGSIGTATLQWTPTAADVGTHFIRIKGANAIGYARYDYYLKPITVQAAPTPAPTITSVSPATLPPSSSPQLITIYGSNFLLPGDPNASSLMFYDPAGNSYARTPINVTTTSMQYNLTVLSGTGTWKVKVVNGSVESSLFTFTVASVNAQLTGLSISGSANVSKNGSAQYASTAIFSDGTTSTVSPSWSLNSGAPASISSSGQLTAGNVSANTLVTITATYTFSGITKAATYNVNIVAGTTSYQLEELMNNGTFASGSTGWTLTGNFQADSRFSFYNNEPGYAYLANSDGSAGNNLSGTLSQTITIPANATTATLGYYYRITSSDTSGVAHDHLHLVLMYGAGNAVGLDDKSNVNANTAYGYASFNVIAYKGLSVTVYFSAMTDGSLPTTFRVDDVSLLVTVPIPSTPVLFGVGGPTSVPERGSAQYNAIVVYSDGSVQSVTPSWSFSGPGTISSSGFLNAGSVSSDTAATVIGNYSGFPALNYPITIVNVAPLYTSLAISGPSSMNENSTAQFTAAAIYSDGTSQSASASWSVISGPGSISTSGLLTVGEVSNNTTTTVSASCTIGGVTHSTTQQVTVLNVPTPPTLASLSISGPSSLNENSTALYSATAWFSDGSSQGVVPTWSEDSVAASISIFGLLSAGEVASDTPVNVSASYTVGGFTRSAQTSVTIVNIVIPAYTLTVTASNGTVAKNPDQATYASGSQVVLTATAATGYQFGSWSGDATGSQNPLSVTMTANKSITANFTVNPVNISVTVQPNPSGRSFTVDGTTYTTAQTFSWVSGSSHPIAASSPQSGGTGIQYVWGSWSDSGAMSHTVAPTVGTTYTANFNTQYYLTMSMGTGGSSYSPASGWQSSGAVVPISATAASGYSFGSWSGSGSGQYSGSSSSTSVTMNGPITEMASFTVTGALPGSVVAWGDNTYGQCNVSRGLTNVVASGFHHSLALKADGTVVGWGENDFGQTNPPAGLSNVAAIAAGWGTSLALKRDGTLEEWGWDGGYGLKATAESLTNIKAIAACWDCFMALRNDNTVFVWGKSTHGETNVPAGLNDVTAIAGGGWFCMALNGDGTVVTWGSNQFGQTNTPANLSGVKAIAAGGDHCLALRSNGTVVAWGYNYYGQTDVPPDLTNAVAVSAGAYHSLALRADGTLVAWGLGSSGQTNIPAGLHGVTAISAGGFHNLALVAGSYPMQLSGVNYLPGGQVQFTVSGLAGDVYRVLGSTNLHDWQTIVSVTNLSGTMQFTDPGAAGYSRRFYRLVMP
jgi:uncharacterized repeat protein (TIGR02543 family)